MENSDDLFVKSSRFERKKRGNIAPAETAFPEKEIKKEKEVPHEIEDKTKEVEAEITNEEEMMTETILDNEKEPLDAASSTQAKTIEGEEWKLPEEPKREESKKNSYYQIRFSGETRNKLDALKNLNLLEGHQKFDYEVMDHLVNTYIEERVDEVDRMLIDKIVEKNRDNYV